MSYSAGKAKRYDLSILKEILTKMHLEILTNICYLLVLNLIYVNFHFTEQLKIHVVSYISQFYRFDIICLHSPLVALYWLISVHNSI